MTTGPDAVARVADDALWAVAVPFTASGPAVEIGTVVLERPIPVVPGRYQAVFQARPGGSGYAHRLGVTLTSNTAPDYAILRQGNLAADHVLGLDPPWLTAHCRSNYGAAHVRSRYQR